VTRFVLALLVVGFSILGLAEEVDRATVPELAARIRRQLSGGEIAAATATLKTLQFQHPSSDVGTSVLRGEILLARFLRDCHPWNVSAGGPVLSVIGRLDSPSGLEMSALAARQYRMRALGLEHADLAAAHRAFLTGESGQPQMPAVIMGLAETHFYRGEKQAALKYLNQAIVNRPKDAHLIHLRGATLTSLGSLRKGTAELRLAVSLQPHHLEARRRLLEQLYLFGDAASSSVHEEWFLSHRPVDLAASRSCGLAWMMISTESRNERATTAAVRLLKALPQRFPDEWEGWYLVAGMYARQRQHAQAESAFTQALALLNGDVSPYRIYRYRATVRQLAEDWTGGLTDADRSIQHEPLSALACEDYNRSLQNLGRGNETGQAARKFQGLVKLYELHRKLDLKPANGELWQRHAQHLVKMGWNDWAFDSFDRAETLLPDSWEPISGKAAVLLAEGQYQAAIVKCNRAIARGAGRSAWSIRGDAWLALKKPTEALRDFERAMRLDDAVATAWLLLAKQRITAKDRKGAEEATREALRISPTRRDEAERLLRRTTSN